MTPLEKLAVIVKARTEPPWNYEDERYSARCVIGLKPVDDRWLAHCQPGLNGEANGKFIATMGTLADLMLDVCIGADNIREDCRSDDLNEKIYALRAAIERMEST